MNRILAALGAAFFFCAPASAAVLGEQRVAILNVNFSDDMSQPWTPQASQDLVNVTVNAFYAENSRDQMSFNATAFGWWTMDLSAIGCNLEQIRTQALAQAALHGVDLTPYRDIILAHPPACGTGTVSTTDQNPGYVWYGGTQLLWYNIAHELAHTFGLSHAWAIRCPGAPLAADTMTCAYWDYGWYGDIMGAGWFGDMNVISRQMLGWVTAQEITASGTYRVYPAEQGLLDPIALRMRRNADQWLYIERRQPLGYDAPMTGYGTNFPDGVILGIGGLNIVRPSPSGLDGNGFQIDMRPDTATRTDSGLVPGQCFTDPQSGISVSVVQIFAGGAADVAVSFGFAGCAAPPPPPPPSNNPPVAVGDSASVKAGQSVTIPVLANDYDPDGDPLTVTGVTQGSKGSVTYTAASVIYSARAGVRGGDSFTYTISDGRGGTASASVAIRIWR